MIFLALIVRTLYSVFYPVNLAGDEAYYWDWGRRPAMGYFSKPPMIAWIYAVVDKVAGASLLSIRVTAILFGTASLFVTYWFTKKLFDSRTALFAVIIALSIPGNCLLNFVLTIDAPLVLVWSLSLLFFWNHINGERKGLSLFLLFLCIGLGHLSKQMMLFFPPLAIAFLASGAETRHLLKKPGTWLAIVGSLIFLAPPLIWNSQNDWITFTHMSTHVGAKQEPTLWATLYERVETFLEFFGSQLGALSPVTAVLLFMLTVVGAFKYRNISTRSRYLIVFCGVPLVLILVVAMFQKVQPNWPAVLYLAGVPMVAAWFTKVIDWFPVEDKNRKRLFRFAIIPGFLLCAFFYFSPMVFSLAGAEGHKANPNRRLIGSARFAKAVQEVRETIPGWETAFVAVAGHRYNTSFLGFGLPDRPRVYNILRGTVDSQYQVWPGPWEDGAQGKDAIIILPGTRSTPFAPVGESFESVQLIANIKVLFGSGVAEYSIFHAQKMKKPLPR